MLKISIDKAKPGMTLAQDVINEAGTIVVPAGKELTDSLINKLSRMNIDIIYIKGERILPRRKRFSMNLRKDLKR